MRVWVGWVELGAVTRNVESGAVAIAAVKGVEEGVKVTLRRIYFPIEVVDVVETDILGVDDRVGDD